MDEPKTDLVEYLRKNIAKGYTAESLKWALVSQGHSRSVVERALEEVNKEPTDEESQEKEKPKIKHEFIGEDNKPIKLKKPFWKKILDPD